ncbi:MAG: glutathione S-transferase family protein [Rhizobiales bacterium]|nr:glutathione S-transferase family protein [Hyphomicrobiales bacterium]MBI3671984.1 glutathione S-transferase family protein [Hyphomicrobiales bacterium]
MAKTASKAAKKAAAKKAAKKPAAVKKQAPAKKRPAEKKPASGGDKQRFTLYGSMTSGPTYTVGLMLSLCRHPFSYIHVNLREGQHRLPDYMVKNRYGQVPTLRDGQTFLVQSAAILEYLAESLGKFEGRTAHERQRIREWLFWQWDKLALPILRLRARARGFRQFGDEVRVMYDTEAKTALAVLEHELARSEWVVGRRPTIADVGVYGVIRYAAEASIDLSPYPHVAAWKKRFETQPGFGTPEQILPMESRLL